MLFQRSVLILLLCALALAVGLFASVPGPVEAAATLAEVKRLTALDADAGDQFAHNVAVNGDVAVVGAPFDDAAAGNAGAIYIFERDAGGADNWGEVKKIIASDAGTFEEFGYSVAVSGDTAIAGAPASHGGEHAGAAYVFERNQGGANNWGEVKKLTASDAAEQDQFGYSVALSGDTALVAARLEDAGGADAGAAYVFERNQGGANNWGEVKKLTASDAQAGDQFGWSIAVSGDTAVVGAALYRQGIWAGAAYVFDRNEGGLDNWGQVEQLTASDASSLDSFGYSVALGGDTAFVGAPGSQQIAGGAVYAFERDQGGANNWGEV
jgi:hypothetical protein